MRWADALLFNPSVGVGAPLQQLRSVFVMSSKQQGQGAKAMAMWWPWVAELDARLRMQQEFGEEREILKWTI